MTQKYVLFKFNQLSPTVSICSTVSPISYILQVDQIYPEQGSYNGGTVVTILGTGFSEDPEVPHHVTFGSTPCHVTSQEASQLLCTMGYGGKTHVVTNDGSHPSEWSTGIIYTH